jgi:hypothetical protein
MTLSSPIRPALGDRSLLQPFLRDRCPCERKTSRHVAERGWDGRPDGMAAHLLGTHAPRAQHRPPQPRAPRRTTVALESANRIIPPCRTLRLAAFVHGTATSGRLIHWMRFLSLPVTGLPKVSSASIPNHARAAMPPYRHRTSCLLQASCHLGHRLVSSAAATTRPRCARAADARARGLSSRLRRPASDDKRKLCTTLILLKINLYHPSNMRMHAPRWRRPAGPMLLA